MDMDGMYVLTAVCVVMCARNWWLYHQNLNLRNAMQELDTENIILKSIREAYKKPIKQNNKKKKKQQAA